MSISTKNEVVYNFFFQLVQAVEEYRMLLEAGLIPEEMQTADIKEIELALAGLLAKKALAKRQGETSSDRKKREIREFRFRNRLILDAKRR